MKLLTPSEAKTTNSSCSVSFLYDTSGTEMRPYSFRQKSPKALAIASPGRSPFGLHSLFTLGSSFIENILPPQLMILKASPE